MATNASPERIAALAANLRIGHWGEVAGVLLALAAERDEARDAEADRICDRVEEQLSAFYRREGGDGYLGGEGVESCDPADTLAAEAMHVSVHFIDERDEARTQLNAWQSAFGSTQLTHALAKRDALAAERDALEIDMECILSALGEGHRREHAATDIRQLLEWLKEAQDARDTLAALALPLAAAVLKETPHA